MIEGISVCDFDNVARASVLERARVATNVRMCSLSWTPYYGDNSVDIRYLVDEKRYLLRAHLSKDQ